MVGEIGGFAFSGVLIMWTRSSLVACCATLWLATSAQAQIPHGPYQVDAINFPSSYTGRVTFDGVAELLGGPAPDGMWINESSNYRVGTSGGIATSGAPAMSFEQSGYIVEFHFDTADDGSYNDTPFAPWQVAATELDFSIEPWRLVEDTFFGYWRTPAGPVTLSQEVITALELSVGPHPTDPSVGQVVYFGNGEEEFIDGWVNFYLGVDAELSAAALEFAFGAAPLSGVTIGAMYQQVNAAVPGDTDADGDVDLEDLNNVRNNFGSSGNPVLGDTAPFDGAVDLEDLNNVRNNFGIGAGGSSAVPEPGALALLCLGAMVGLLARRRS